jgi:precorrin-6B methylase 2
VVVGAGWEPTSRKKVRKMLEMSRIGPSDVVYDLGSGDGRIILEAARTFHAKAIGIEADPVRFLLSKLAIALFDAKDRASVVWGNFFHTNLSDATIVTVFLSQGTNQRLKSKLLSELKPGTRVVSYVWTFEDWTPAVTEPADKLSLYIIPER